MQYIVFKTPFGFMAAVISPEGVRRIFLPCGSRRAVKKMIITQFPFAIPGTGRAFTKIASALYSYFKGRALRDVFALDFGWATAFQRAIYNTLAKTRPGTIISYSELARRAGCPHSARAVGNAMRRNQIPIIIPCHRVIRQDGRIGNFSAIGGADLKRKLLKLEGAVVK